jgi:hypothetical protein
VNTLCKTLAGLTFFGVACGANAQSALGITVGGFFPTDSEIRDLVGKSFLQFGISPGGGITKEKYSIKPELTFLGGSGNGNRFSIWGLPVTITIPLGMGRETNIPYVAAGIGPTYFDYNITRPGPTNFNDKGFGVISHIEGGMVFSQNLKLSIRYNMLSEKDGFNFNGVQVGLSWQFFKL